MKSCTRNLLTALLALAVICTASACGKYKKCDPAAEAPCPEGKICLDIGLQSTVCLAACDPAAADACGANEACFRFGAGQSACAPTCSDDSFLRRCPEGWLCAPVAGDDSICRPACDPAAGTAACADGQYCMNLGGGTGVCMPGCDPYSSEGCGEGQACERTADGGYSCFGAVYIEGRVVDSADTSQGIADAHVSASDKTGAVATDVAVSGADGSYRLQVPVPRTASGGLTDGTFTLRGEAGDYQPYPSGIRPAIPVDATQAAEQEDGTYVLQNAATDIALIALPEAEQGRTSISGSIALADADSTRPGGTLVVAEGGPCGLTCPFSFSDKQGNFTIFNVPAGDWTVRGYKEFLQLTPAGVTHADTADATGVVLQEKEKPYETGSVSGSVNIVNPGDGDNTTVVLVPVSTFSDTFVKGEVPPGLRAPKQPAAPNVRGAFSITGVPDGSYVVLAAFENDFLVRDPDTSIAGTALVYQEVPDPATSSYDISLPTSFKVTGALTIVSPGATGPEQIDPSDVQLVWKDDSSEKHYLIVVYNAFGEKMLDCEIPGQSGGANVTYGYDSGEGTCSTPAQPLESGMYYQFRVQSTDAALVPKAQTEDLLGVFYAP